MASLVPSYVWCALSNLYHCQLSKLRVSFFAVFVHLSEADAEMVLYDKNATKCFLFIPLLLSHVEANKSTYTQEDYYYCFTKRCIVVAGNPDFHMEGSRFRSQPSDRLSFSWISSVSPGTPHVPLRKQTHIIYWMQLMKYGVKWTQCIGDHECETAVISWRHSTSFQYVLNPLTKLFGSPCLSSSLLFCCHTFTLYPYVPHPSELCISITSILV